MARHNEDSVLEDVPTEEAPTETEAAPAADAKPKRVKTPIEEGNVAPVQFAKEIDKHLGNPEGHTRPQIVYGYMKTGKDFPKIDRGEDAFPREVVPLTEGLAWIDAKNARKLERDIAKAAKEAEASTATKTDE